MGKEAHVVGAFNTEVGHIHCRSDFVSSILNGSVVELGAWGGISMIQFPSIVGVSTLETFSPLFLLSFFLFLVSLSFSTVPDVS